MPILYDLVPPGILHGLILAFIAFGIMIPFRLLNLHDLSAEGAYPLGAVISACLILSGIHAFLATLIATLLAGLVGLGTALIYIRYKTPPLLVSIILSTMLYSVHLRLMGTPNLALFTHNTLFNLIPDLIFLKISGVIFLFLVLAFLFYQFLNTEIGLRFRAVGLNPLFAQRQGISLKRYLLLGLFLGSALAGASGSLMAQVQGYVDINMGVGMVIHALAALMIGEGLIGNHTLRRQILAPFLGALVYQQIQGLALAIGLQPTDLKLLTGSIVLSLMMLRGKTLCTL